MFKKISLNPSAAIIIAGVVIAGAILYTNAHPAPAANADAQGNLPTSVNIPPPSASDHIIGSPQAPVVLVEYSDFQCPYCSMVYPTLKSIVQNSNGQVAWVMRDFPLKSIHPQANGAANAAECIAAQLGNTGWWEYADNIFSNQDKMNDAYYRQLAQQFGANMAQYDACVENQTYQSKIDQEEADAEVNGGEGTPYTVVYGGGLEVPVSGAQSAATFNSVIQEVEQRQQ